MINDINELVCDEYDGIKYILMSEIRLNILFELYDSDKTLVQLKNRLKKQETNLLRTLKELEEKDLIEKNDKTYSITTVGFLITSSTIKFIDNHNSVHAHEKFWESHSIEGIPFKFLRNVDSWRYAKMIKSTEIEYYKPLTCYVENILKSKYLKVILPIFSYEHIKAILESLEKNNGPLTLITSKKILDAITKSDLSEVFFKNKEDNKIKLYLDDDDKLNMFLTCTNTFSSLSLFYLEGDYDDSSMLIEDDPNIIKKNNKLFEFYKPDFRLT